MKITIQLIEDTLSKLKIPYQVVGNNDSVQEFEGFCSFRNPQDNGIYYSAGDYVPNKHIENSLFICEKQLPGLTGETNLLLIVDNSQLVFYKVLQWFYQPEPKSGIHPTAIVDTEAEIDEDAEIGPYCVIGKAKIGKGTILKSHIVVYDDTTIGNHVIIEPNSVIGATGVAWIWDNDTKQRIAQPQIGGVVIESNVFIGSDVSIVRGSLNEKTEIGEGSMISHGSKIGHGCRLGKNVHFANNISIAGNVDLGDRCFLGSGAVIRPQIQLASDTTVGAGAVVVKKCLEKNQILVGVPAKAMPNPDRKLQGVPLSLK